MCRDKAKGYDKFGNKINKDANQGPMGKWGLAFSLSTHDNPPPGCNGEGENAKYYGPYGGRGIQLVGEGQKIKLAKKGNKDWN